MTRAELIDELKRIAHTFEGHPAHIGMSDTLRATVEQMNVDAGVIYYLRNPKPSPPSSGQPPRTPDDT